MKTISKYIGIAFTAFALASCTGLLEEHNPTGMSDICATEETMEAGIIGIQYGFVPWSGLSGMGAITLDYCSGLNSWVKEKWFTQAEYYANLNFTTLPSDGDLFAMFYTVISRANDMLGNLPASSVNDDFKLEIEAEARFYRAVAYYYLVRLYGDVPLRLKTTTTEDATYCPRESYYNVYQAIVEDFNFAYEHMRTPQRVKAMTPGYARPDRYAAIAYLADLYCTIGSLLASPDDNFWNPDKEDRTPDFTALGISKDYVQGAKDAYKKALEYAEMLIPESASHDANCQYSLLEKFGDIFAYDPEFSRNGYTAHVNPEHIFTITGSITSGIASPYVQYRLPQYADGTSATVENSNQGRVRPNRFFFQKWCSTYPGAASAILKAEGSYDNSADPRFDVSFYSGLMKRTIGGSNTTMYPLTNSTSTGSMYAFYKKTASKRGTNVTSDADVILMRFAKVYLIAAEAAAYLDDEGTARKYMEVIHARARHSVADGAADAAVPTWNGLTFDSKEDLLTAIFWENEFEFAGESQDYFNVHRHGARWIIKNICIPNNESWANEDNQKVHDFLFPGFSYPEDYNSSPSDPSSDVYAIRKALLMSFPTTELNYNTGITSEQAMNDYNYQR